MPNFEKQDNGSISILFHCWCLLTIKIAISNKFDEDQLVANVS